MRDYLARILATGPAPRIGRNHLTCIFSVGIVLLLLGIAVLLHGWPIDIYTWAMVATIVAAGWIAGYVRRALWFIPLVVVIAAYLAWPWMFFSLPFVEEWSLFDDHGGRTGTLISPGLRFGRSGPNTQLLESYLGPLPPHWRVQAPLFPGIRDGNERVRSRNVIRDAKLRKILQMLPTVGARKQVLACLVDPENRLRVHQSMLLTCLGELGFPPGCNAERWWQFHEPLFVRENNAHAAVAIVLGWSDTVRELEPSSAKIISQLRAASDQESFLGHGDFAEAFQALKRSTNTSTPPPSNVLWWPLTNVDASNQLSPIN